MEATIFQLIMLILGGITMFYGFVQAKPITKDIGIIIFSITLITIII